MECEIRRNNILHSAIPHSWVSILHFTLLLHKAIHVKIHVNYFKRFSPAAYFVNSLSLIDNLYASFHHGFEDLSLAGCPKHSSVVTNNIKSLSQKGQFLWRACSQRTGLPQKGHGFFKWFYLNSYILRVKL